MFRVLTCVCMHSGYPEFTISSRDKRTLILCVCVGGGGGGGVEECFQSLVTLHWSVLGKANTVRSQAGNPIALATMTGAWMEKSSRQSQGYSLRFVLRPPETDFCSDPEDMKPERSRF